MQYRQEIDGLRAVAVVPVILYHGGISLFSGGYVGVDVFFVISGYLITTIVSTEIRDGRFSLLTFYERRARRILPALALICLCCVPFVLAWMIPAQQQAFARSLTAVFGFVSNIYFWRHSDYFAPEAEESPLLHTWSLSVEEQYYLFFPPLLLLLLRFRDSITIWVLALGAAGSLALSEYASWNYPGANFYLLPTRAWELLIGSLCSLILARRGQLRHEGLAALGLAMIGGAIFSLDESTRFPSLFAVLPVLGSALIILYAAEGTLVARALSLKMAVSIGLISYSAYLWHQPVFAFARIRIPGAPPVWLMISLSFLSLVFAALSWRFVEQPFRRRLKDDRSRARARVLTAAVVTSTVFVAVGFMGSGKAGLFGGKLNDSDLAAYLDEQFATIGGLGSDCGPSTLVSSLLCKTGPDPVVAIWGDSFAQHIVPAVLSSTAGKVPVVQFTQPRCGPFADTAPYSSNIGLAWSRSCAAFNNDVLDWLRQAPSVEYVVMASPFRAYLSEDWEVLHDGGLENASFDLGLEIFRRTLSEIEAMGKTPVVVSPTPQSGMNIGRCLSTQTWIGGDTSLCDFALKDAAEITRITTGSLIVSRKITRLFASKELCVRTEDVKPNGEILSCIPTRPISLWGARNSSEESWIS